VREPTKRSATLPSSPTQAGGVVSDAAEENKRTNKQTKLLDLLRRPAGATIALSEASGWQQHSVRGFLAGVVRKKLGLELASAVETDQRIYRVIAAK
jgi:hypothetical protein